MASPIHNLKAEDFELYEDDVRQEIRTFEFINFSSPPPLPPLPPGLTTNEIEPGGIFTVVIDEIGIQVDDVQAVRRAAQRFFDETLQPNDHVAVVRSGVNSGFFLTNDRTLAVEAIAQSTGRRERTLGITEPGATDATMPRVLRRSRPSAAAKTAATVSACCQASSNVCGRFVPGARRSSGSAAAAICRRTSHESFELQRNVGRDDDAFTRLIEAARAANVAIYTVDPRGLQSAAADLSRDLMPMDVTSLRDLAALTGGRAVLTNDLNGELEKVAAENRAYYLLGYEPAPVTSKRVRPRKLRVTTKAPGVALLHRSVFLPGSESKIVAPDLLATPLPVRDLPITLAPAAVALDRRKRGLLVPFEIGGNLRDGTDVEYSALALDAGGKVVSRAAGRGKAKNGRVAGEVGLTDRVETYTGEICCARAESGSQRAGLCHGARARGQYQGSRMQRLRVRASRPARRVSALHAIAPVTISTLVSAEKLEHRAPFSFAPGSRRRDSAKDLAGVSWVCRSPRVYGASR